MVAIQPEPSDLRYSQLPNTREELKQIAKHVPASSLIKLGDRDSPSSNVETVLSRLPHVSIAHFACHGIANSSDPLASALLLNDGLLEVSKIMEQSLPNASLAFLSACETAVGDVRLPDEAFHLAATTLFCGFRGVVATMW